MRSNGRWLLRGRNLPAAPSSSTSCCGASRGSRSRPSRRLSAKAPRCESPPWQSVPSEAETTGWENGPRVTRRDPKAGALLDRMLAASLSQFEPSPIEALKAAKALRPSKMRA